MLDKSIDGALLALRKQIVRGDGAGLAHVEALLALRGVAMPRVLPVKRADAAKRGQMRRPVLDALKGGPLTSQEVSAKVAARRRELTAPETHRRTVQTLGRLKGQGLVSVEAGLGRWVWKLAP